MPLWEPSKTKILAPPKFSTKAFQISSSSSNSRITRRVPRTPHSTSKHWLLSSVTRTRISRQPRCFYWNYWGSPKASHRPKPSHPSTHRKTTGLTKMAQLTTTLLTSPCMGRVSWMHNNSCSPINLWSKTPWANHRIRVWTRVNSKALATISRTSAAFSPTWTATSNWLIPLAIKLNRSSNHSSLRIRQICRRWDSNRINQVCMTSSHRTILILRWVRIRTLPCLSRHHMKGLV